MLPVTSDDERRIERFVRRPETMAEKERRRAEQLVNEDPGAALYAEFLEDLYGRLDEESERPSDPRVDAFVDSLFESTETGARENEKAPVIPVHPHRSGRQARPTVLAADAPAAVPNESEKRFVDLASLSSDDEKILVRILGDRKTGHGRLYVLSVSGDDTRTGEAHAVVSFPELGRDIVTDGEGRASFDLAGIDDGPGDLAQGSLKKWAEVSAVVRRPVAATELRPSETATLPETDPSSREGSSSVDPSVEEMSSRVICRHRGDQLGVTLEREDSGGPVLLGVSSPEGGAFLVSLRTGTPAPVPVPDERRLVLRLYR